MSVNGIEIRAGQQWRTRCGLGVLVVGVKGPEDPRAYYPVVGEVEGVRRTWTKDGVHTIDGPDNRLDLFELIRDVLPKPAEARAKADAALDDLPPLTSATPSAPDLLDAAAKHMRDRAATYDKPEGERSMAATVAAFNAQTGRDLSESEGWLLLVNLKIVRDRQRDKPHRDSIEDGVAYTSLYGEARLKEGGAS